ncbi:MAG: LPP20 family lipoprotein, partial [Armatimonadetes bacterium]|nr:LPP20 family lipoprotein [Armatimonadota bacterium]
MDVPPFRTPHSVFRTPHWVVSHTPILPYIVCASLLLLMAVAQAFAADSPIIEKSSAGWVNWDRQVIKAVGHGILPGDAEDEAQARLMARSAAIADAYRNLASVTRGVRVTGETYVKNFVTESDEIRLKVEGFIRGAEIISEKQLSDRSFEVILQAPLVG